MFNRSRELAAFGSRCVLAVALGVAVLGCSSSTAPGGDTGGGGQSGGHAGQASGGSPGGAPGATGTGGTTTGSGGTTTSTGGTTATGGTMGTGGVTTTGGTTGTGGSAAAGGTTGVAGKTGAAGMTGAEYDPCPTDGSDCKIMPLGDSITEGAKSSDYGGYREPLFHLAHAAGKKMTFVGSQTKGPTTVDGVTFPRYHEGYAGYTIDYTGGSGGALTKNMLTPNNIKTYKPHIVLLMIGTNDIFVNEDNRTTRLATLIDTILSTDPNLLLVVAQIIPGEISTPDSFNISAKAYNAAIPDLVSTRAAAGKHIKLVDQNTPFATTANYSTALLSDGVHPTDAGYKIMANVWWAAISSLLH